MGEFNGKTKVKDLLANPEAAAILEEYIPGFTTAPETKQAYGMSIKAMCAFPQVPLTKEQSAEMIAKFEAIE